MLWNKRVDLKAACLTHDTTCVNFGVCFGGGATKTEHKL